MRTAPNRQRKQNAGSQNALRTWLHTTQKSGFTPTRDMLRRQAAIFGAATWNSALDKGSVFQSTNRSSTPHPAAAVSIPWDRTRLLDTADRADSDFPQSDLPPTSGIPSTPELSICAPELTGPLESGEAADSAEQPSSSGFFPACLDTNFDSYTTPELDFDST